MHSPKRHRRPARPSHPALAHLPFAVVMALVVVAGLRIWAYHWRQGAVLIGMALLVAAVLRAALPDEKTGLLVIRGRGVDVLSYAGLGIVILFVAVTIARGPIA